jgi:hypothetical protein
MKMPVSAQKQISKEELAQRVAIVKRFRELLAGQRERFYNYLAVLDKQQGVIVSGSAEDLLSYVEMEERIVADIFSIQKIIDPLELMYRATVPGADADASGDDVPAIKSALEQLQIQAVQRSNHNRALLSNRMAEIRTEIRAMRNNPFARRSPYQAALTASLIDVRG